MALSKGSAAQPEASAVVATQPSWWGHSAAGSCSGVTCAATPAQAAAAASGSALLPECAVSSHALMSCISLDAASVAASVGPSRLQTAQSVGWGDQYARTARWCRKWFHQKRCQSRRRHWQAHLSIPPSLRWAALLLDGRPGPAFTTRGHVKCRRRRRSRSTSRRWLQHAAVASIAEAAGSEHNSEEKMAKTALKSPKELPSPYTTHV